MPSRRLHQTVLLVSLTLFSWLAMMLVHELGHMLGAIVTGGQIRRLVWHPLAFSRTDVFPNPSPLVVTWAGPVVGVLLPLLLDRASSFIRLRIAYLVTFFAGFCLIANGAYVGLGVIEGIGDAGELLRRGSPAWTLFVFGVLSVSAGLWLWHLASPRLGFAFGDRGP